MTSPVIPAGAVTAADVMGELGAVRADIADLKQTVAVMNALSPAVNSQVADHETRIREIRAMIPDNLATRVSGLEQWRWKMAGAIVLGGVIIGVLSGLISALAHH